MTAAWEVIGSQTLGSAAASVTFSSIPQGYRDLILVINAGSTTAGASYARANLNSDTGSNYSRVYATANGSSVSSAASTNTFMGISNTVGIGDSIKFQAICQFLDYSATDKHKTMLLRNGGGEPRLNMAANRWANTAAITNIELKLDSGSYSTGSTFTLYGSNRA